MSAGSWWSVLQVRILSLDATDLTGIYADYRGQRRCLARLLHAAWGGRERRVQ